MAVAIILSVIAFTLSFQDIRGQPNLNSNGPVAQNNLNQGFPTNSGVKASPDFTLNSGNLATNLNTQLQSNLPQTLSSSMSMPSFFSLQPQQSMQQLLNQPQVTNFQQPSYQQLNSGQSFLQQSLMPSTVVQQPNIQQASNAFVPNFSPYNYPQQLPLSSHLVNMPSSGISNPASSIFSTYPSMSNCGCPQTGFGHNSGNTYLGSLSNMPLVSERPQVITSYSTIPYSSVLSSHPSAFTNNAMLQYQNDGLGLLNNHEIEEKILLLDDEESLDSDNITSLLLSLLQTSKKSSKVSPYPYALQGTKLSKSSHLKSLLPVILNLLKDKKERCNCDSYCKCKRKHKKDKKGSEPQIGTGYSKKKDIGNLREEMFNNKSDEEIPRIVREHKKYNKFKNIPDESIESLENEDFYEDDK